MHMKAAPHPAFSPFGTERGMRGGPGCAEEARRRVAYGHTPPRLLRAPGALGDALPCPCAVASPRRMGRAGHPPRPNLIENYNGRLGVALISSPLNLPSRYWKYAADAIIAALSVQKIGGGMFRLMPAFWHRSLKTARRREFAATPPDIAKLLTPKVSHAAMAFFASVSTTAS